MGSLRLCVIGRWRDEETRAEDDNIEWNPQWGTSSLGSRINTAIGRCDTFGYLLWQWRDLRWWSAALMETVVRRLSGPAAMAAIAVLAALMETVLPRLPFDCCVLASDSFGCHVHVIMSLQQHSPESAWPSLNYDTDDSVSTVVTALNERWWHYCESK